ncbi:MAG: hypothetical protein V4598_05270 [Bdellovibrionota bacterium]
MKDRKQQVIAVINSTIDVVDILEICLQDEGYNTVGGLIPDFKRGQKDMVAFMEEHRPDLIVWDIAPPYEQNVIFLKMVRNMRVMENVKWIFTTTNKAALAKTSESIEAHEIIGKPMDLEVIINLVKTTLAK